MKNMILLATGVASLLGLAAMQSGGTIPLNVKTGEWENVQDVTVQGSLGLPPEAAANMTPAMRARYEALMAANAGKHTLHTDSKSCLKPEDLAGNVFDKMNKNNHNEKCHGTVIRSTSSDVEVQEHCDAANGGGGVDFHLLVHADDPEHTTITGEGTANVGGKTMKSQLASKGQWLGPKCTDE